MAIFMRHCVAAGWMLWAAGVPAWASESEATSCDRSCLETVTKTYLTALTKQDVVHSGLAPDAKYTENQERIAPGEGLWKVARRIGSYQIFMSDVRTGQSVFMGNVETRSGWSMLTVRLKVQDRMIREAEVIWPGLSASSGAYDLGGAVASLGRSRVPLSTALTPQERRDRWQLIQAADLHYEGIERGNGDIVPFGDRCVKVENGVQLILNPAFPSPMRSPSGVPLPNFQAMGCTQQFNTHVWDTDSITDRRYPVVDEERGIVVAFAMYNQYVKGPCATVVDHGPACPARPVPPYSLVVAEAFKVRAGFIEEVESIFTVLPHLRLRGEW